LLTDSPTAFDAAKWITESKSYFSNTLAKASRSQQSAFSNGTSTPVILRTPSTASMSLFERLSTITTSYPALINSTAVCEPI